MRFGLFALVLVAACGGGGSDPTVPPGPTASACPPTPGLGVSLTAAAGLSRWGVLPKSTDSCLARNLDTNFVYRAPGLAPAGKLLVFLPGTGAIPQYYTLILAEAAKAGYHAIGLTYPNDQAIGTLCAATGGTCYGEARLEVLTGQAVSAVVTVDRRHSIEHRLARLLAFMQSTEPAGSWSQFLVGDSTINWSKVSIAGHSQGGGHALFIAQRYAVWRGSAYSSGGDVLPGGATAAAWLGNPFATTGDRLYGFISTADELVPPATTIATWGAIGMGAFGAAANVDAVLPPFGNAHRLTTTAAPANPGLVIGPNHNVVVVDVNTPRVTGTTTPVFAAVWRYLSFP